MAHSSILGAERAPAVPAGRDAGTLGPSDSSDSGSDVAGIEGVESGDPALPADVALGDGSARTPTPSETLAGDSDAAGTGERRSAGGDAGRDGGDIGIDRIVGDPDAGDVDDTLDAAISAGEHEDPNDEEDDEEHETPRKEEHPASPRRRQHAA